MTSWQEPPGPSIPPYRTDGTAAGDEEAIRRATSNWTMCLYCRKRADRDSRIYLRLVRGDERRAFSVTRCKECAAGQEQHIGALGCLLLVIGIAIVGLLIGAIWNRWLLIGAAVAAIVLVVFGILANRARHAEWKQMSPPILALIGEGWQLQ